MDFNPPIESDVAPLSALIDQVLQADSAINAMRDPTRGGVAATLFEWVTPETDIVIEEQSLPVRPDVAAACAILGMDPLYIANEGIVLLSVPARDAESVLRILQSVERGKHAAIIGEVREGGGSVYALTEYGTHRRIMMPRGELLPRIC
jgi:hydrogenase expression/formation protein HypE